MARPELVVAAHPLLALGVPAGLDDPIPVVRGHAGPFGARLLAGDLAVIRRRGQAFTKTERLAILATFDANQNLTETAKVHGVSVAGVLKLVRGRRDAPRGGAGRGDAEPRAPRAARGGQKMGDATLLASTPSQDTPGEAGEGRTAMEVAAFEAPPAPEPRPAATTQPAPALTLLSPPHPSKATPPTQSESKTRATSWELVGSIALASKAVLSLFHEELQSELPDGRSLNEFASILQKLHISYGITVEKARLLHNESTGIIAKVEDLSKLPEGVTLDVAIAFVRGTIHGKLPA